MVPYIVLASPALGNKRISFGCYMELLSVSFLVCYLAFVSFSFVTFYFCFSLLFFHFLAPFNSSHLAFSFTKHSLLRSIPLLYCLFHLFFPPFLSPLSVNLFLLHFLPVLSPSSKIDALLTCLPLPSHSSLIKPPFSKQDKCKVKLICIYLIPTYGQEGNGKREGRGESNRR